MPLVLDLEQLKVVDEELEVIEDLEPIEVEDNNLLIENEDTGGCITFCNSDDDTAHIYGAT